jgi:hypothetical protein
VVPAQACGSGEASRGEQDAPARYSARVGAIELRQASLAALAGSPYRLGFVEPVKQVLAVL